MRRSGTVILAVFMAVFFAGGFTVRHSYAKRFETAKSSAAIDSPLTAYASEASRSDVGGRSDIDMRPMETFYSVLRLLREHYVEPIEDSQRRDLTYGALKNMLDSLKDPYTRFLEPEQKDLAEEARQGKFHGIGAVFGVRKLKNDDGTFEQLVVVSALPGSTAEKAGLKSGDVILKLDGKSILPYDPYQKANKLIKAAKNGEIERAKLEKLLSEEEARIKDGISFQRAADKLSSPFKDTVELTLQRGLSTLKVKVASEDITVKPVEYSVSEGIAYIRINLFSASVRDEFLNALADAEKQHATGMVLDLRGNPGGSIDMAIQVARLFAPGSGFAILARSGGKRQTIKIPERRADERVETWTRPVAVLVDGGTASAAELLAGALRDSRGAKLVGGRTFGQALEVTMLPQRDGSAVEMTTGKFLTPKGTDFYIKGLKADVEIDDAAGQLARARELAKHG